MQATDSRLRSLWAEHLASHKDCPCLRVVEKGRRREEGEAHRLGMVRREGNFE